MILTNCDIKEIHIHKEVDQFISSGQSEKVLMIYPTNRKIRQLKKNLIGISPRQTVSRLNLHTLTTFSQLLLGRSKKYRELSEAAAGVFIKKSAESCDLKYFRNYGNSIPPGTLNRIKNVISKYKENGITPEILLEETSKLSNIEQLKATDISKIFLNYNKLCKSTNAFELGDVYHEINSIEDEKFNQYFRNVFPAVDLVLVSGFNEFTMPERKILDRVAKINDTRIFLEFDNYNYNTQIFSEIEKTIEPLIQLGFRRITDLAEEDNNSFTKHIRSNLFRVNYKEPVKKFNDSVKVIRAYDREKEVELIAKEIKTVISEEGIDPSKICVVFNLIENYNSLIKYTFRQFGIPFNLTDRTLLSDSYPVSAVLNFLEIAEDDFYYKNIARAFKSGFIDLGNIDISNLIKVGAKLKVVKGYNNWKNSFERALESRENPEDNQFQRQDFIRIEKALEDIENLHLLLAPFKYKMTISGFIKSFMKIIETLNLPQLLIDNPSEEDEKNIKSFTLFLNTIEEIFNLLKEDYSNDTKFSLGFFLDHIRTACRQGRFNIKEKTDYGVLVTTPNEIRGLGFDYMFMGGMVDGDLPTRYSPEIFFAECYAKKEYEHILSERYLFYQVLSSWQKGLIISIPTVDKQKELSESTFVKELMKIIDVTELTGSNYESLLYSEEELQVAASINYNNVLQKNDLSEVENNYLGIEAKRKIAVDKIKLDNPFAESVYNGFINADRSDNVEQAELFPKIKGSTNLMEEFLDKEYSSSELEVYAKCPFKYFLERVLKIDSEAEPTEEIEAFELGSLLHTILYEFYSDLRNKNISLKACSDKVFKDSVNLIMKIAESHISKSSFKSPLVFYDIEKLTGLNGDRTQSILYKFVETERISDEKAVPKFFEVSFGNSYRDQFDEELNLSSPVIIDDIKIKGKIDRIELDEDNDEFNITDYKLSAKKPSKDDIFNGVSLQLPLYLLCAKSLLKYKFDKEINPAFIYLYSLKFSNNDFGKTRIQYGRGKLNHEEFNRELMEATRENIKLFINNITGGNFPLSKLEERENKVCRYCEFKSVCRVGELLQ